MANSLECFVVANKVYPKEKVRASVNFDGSDAGGFGGGFSVSHSGLGLAVFSKEDPSH